jgi:excinuclease ABC subunit A
MVDKIIIKGAREHNLKNIDLEIPKYKLVVFTGLSGSGKSSLAFDTIYAEGQRRYVESLSSYARQFLGVMKKPDVDYIEGLSPSISIDQKSTSHNPRSTVGTVTEIYDYLRLLFARVGHPHCPNCGEEITRTTKEKIVEDVVTRFTGSSPERILIMAPIVKGRKGEYTDLFRDLKKRGIQRVRIDGHVFSVDEDFVLIKTNKHTIEAIVDRMTVDKNVDRQRLIQSIEQALALGSGEVIISKINDAGFAIPEKPKEMEDTLFSEKFVCLNCG